MVRKPRARGGAEGLHGGVIEGAKRNMKPVWRRHSPASAGRGRWGRRGPQDIGAPQREVTARLPCLATFAPAAAATRAAPEEMLKVSGPPPPVPTHRPARRVLPARGDGHGVGAHDLDEAGQLGACSPRVARTASRDAISTSGTPPARIWVRTSAACSRVRAAPSRRAVEEFLQRGHVLFIILAGGSGLRDGRGVPGGRAFHSCLVWPGIPLYSHRERYRLYVTNCITASESVGDGRGASHASRAGNAGGGGWKAE